jgi:hypothetical protein
MLRRSLSGLLTSLRSNLIEQKSAVPIALAAAAFGITVLVVTHPLSSPERTVSSAQERREVVPSITEPVPVESPVLTRAVDAKSLQTTALSPEESGASAETAMQAAVNAADAASRLAAQR